ncbi:hypothetical protein D9V37_05410 [Nocardioides mangrovicus]|uniref:Uncharacterized protein n=1 Tax=Nocardioides mangrovicus TaxID=2478913 RepID=A0A3L8P439_9ACTN|nr:hypothetical protein D9V37_05410 [Nocardioides mangrovicus]
MLPPSLIEVERIKDGSQVRVVVMRESRTDRRLAGGRPLAPLRSEDLERQAEAGEEDQSADEESTDRCTDRAGSPPGPVRARGRAV